MNSIAQQAVPKGMGQMDDLRPHFTTAATVVVMMSPPAWTDGYVGSTNLPLTRSSSPMTGLLFPVDSAVRRTKVPIAPGAGGPDGPMIPDRPEGVTPRDGPRGGGREPAPDRGP